MSWIRFSQITRNLHFEDTEKREADFDRTRTASSTYKIERFVEAAYEGFRDARAPGEHLAFDEMVRRNELNSPNFLSQPHL